MEKKVKTTKVTNTKKSRAKKEMSEEEALAKQVSETANVLNDVNSKGYELYKKIGEVIPEGTNLSIVYVAIHYLIAEIFAQSRIEENKINSILDELCSNVVRTFKSTIERNNKAK